jgi:hypothetical protein
MAITLTKSGIVNNTTIQAWHVTQSINALTGLVAYDITISGSLTVTGSFETRGFSNATASWSTNTVNAPTKITGEYIPKGSTTGVTSDLKIAAGYGEIIAGNTFVDLTFNNLNTKILGTNCFVSVGISSSYTTGSMAYFPRVESLTAGVMRFSVQTANPANPIPFFYTIIHT